MWNSQEELFDKYWFYPSPETIRYIEGASIAIGVDEEYMIDMIKSVIRKTKND